MRKCNCIESYVETCGGGVTGFGAGRVSNRELTIISLGAAELGTLFVVGTM